MITLQDLSTQAAVRGGVDNLEDPKVTPVSTLWISNYIGLTGDIDVTTNPDDAIGDVTVGDVGVSSVSLGIVIRF